MQVYKQWMIDQLPLIKDVNFTIKLILNKLEGINILLFGSEGSGRSSIVNMLAGKYIAEVSNSASQIHKHVENYKIKCNDLILNITDVGNHTKEFIDMIRKNNLHYHLAIFVFRKGRIYRHDTAITNFIKLTMSIPTFIAVTECEFEFDWVKIQLDDLISIFKIGNFIPITTLLRTKEYEKYYNKSKLTLYNNIKSLSTVKQYQCDSNFIFDDDHIYLQHKKTGLYFGKYKLSDKPINMIIKHGGYEAIPITDKNTIQIGYKNKVLYKTFFNYINYENKSTKYGSEQYWEIMSQNEYIKNGDTIKLKNRKDDYFINANNNGVITCKKDEDEWIILLKID
jgi:energy-coupling factor transporter ATP-binding protein EcfA2